MLSMFNTLEVKWDPIIPFDPEYRDKCLQEQPHAQNIEILEYYSIQEVYKYFKENREKNYVK